ncbi:MAG: hypothetical protein H0T64_14065, partial [Pyrinomonadaceae bacterium]|nr:hypothetical protein [Pyrinomonadaceae bacterium]
MERRKFFLSMLLVVIAATASCLVTRSNGSNVGDRGTPVSVIRTPDGGLVPEVSLDKQGVLHLAYGKGSDGYYVQSRDGGKTFSSPVQLNRRAGIVAVGGERGPKIAIGKDGAIQVAWLGQRSGGIW